MLNFFLQGKVLIILSIFIAASWLLLAYRILEVPPGINGDEAAIGYNAALVSKNGYDSNGSYLPLFTAAKGSFDWKQPVTIYSTVAVFKIFGVSYFNLRATSVFFAIASGILIFFLTRELLGFKKAAFSLFIFLTIPAVTIQSHLALENIAPVPFVSFWLWMVIKYSKEPKMRYLIAGSVSLSVSLFSYLGMKLIVPVFLALNIVLLFYSHGKDFKKVIPKAAVLILVFVLFLSVFPIVKEKYPGSFFGQYRPYNIVSYQQFFLPYLSYFDPSFLFLKGDIVPYHSTGKQGMFLLSSLPLFILGLIKIAKGSGKAEKFIALCFFLTPLLFGLGSDSYRASRVLSLIPFFAIISTIGFWVLYKVRKFLAYLIVIFIVLNFMDFLNDYWFQYPKRVQQEFSKPYHLIFEKAAVVSKEGALDPFIEQDFRSQNKLAIDFFEQAYFRETLPKWKPTDPLPKSSVVIVNFSDEIGNMAYEKIEGTNLAILVNR